METKLDVEGWCGVVLGAMARTPPLVKASVCKLNLMVAVSRGFFSTKNAEFWQE